MSASKKYQSLVAGLPTLTKKELRTLRGLIAQLLEGEVEFEGKEEYRALLDELQAQGVVVPPGYQLNATYTALWHSYLPAIRALLVKFDGAAGRGVAYALLRLLYRLLMADMRGRNIPLSPGSVITNLGRLGAVFESEFPGYLKAGLGGLIIERLGGKNV